MLHLFLCVNLLVLNEGLLTNICVEQSCFLKYHKRFFKLFQDPSDLVDIEVVEEVVRNAICLASTDINLTKWLTGSTQNLPRPDSTAKPSSPRHVQEPVFETMEAKETQSAVRIFLAILKME